MLPACGSDNGASGTSDSTSITSDSSGIAVLKPKGPKPTWAPNITDPMQAVVEKLASYNAPPLTSLPATEARMQPTPATAVKDLMAEHNIPVPPSKVDTSGQDIPVAGGTIHARIYTPQTSDTNLPVILYIHGGGWVIADLDTYDASARGLAEQTGAILVSVHYRQAPEHKFPTAHNDCFAAYQWVLKNAASFKGNPEMVALAGESAGGNLAASVSMMARDKGTQMPLHQVLVYPIAGYDFTTESYRKSDSTKPLNTGLMKWFFDKYLPSPSTGNNPMISLVKANLKGLPPTTIIGAEIDPLLSEGQLLADKLREAGVSVTYKKYDGVVHEFFGMAAIIPEAKDAQALAASQLKKAFNN